jgi:3-phosphoshikimate 1-carboxyvinyltransferase
VTSDPTVTAADGVPGEASREELARRCTIVDALEILPFASPPDAVVRVPGSKSFSNRALVTAALADGVSTLRGVLFSDDTEAMLCCLAALGIAVEVDRSVRTVVVHGCGGEIPATEATLDVRQSGTTARFIVPMLAFAHGTFVVDGHPQMRARPMNELSSVLSAGEVPHETDRGRLPFRISPSGQRGGGVVSLRGDASSQFLSGVLLSAPYGRGGTTIELTSELVSAPYVSMTIATMQSFGVTVAVDDSMSHFVVPAGVYAATDYDIEPDASAASYFFGAAAITAGKVRVEGLGRSALQGDMRFVRDLATMGAKVEQGDDWTSVQGPPIGQLHGGTFDLTEHSDTAPTLAAVAAFASEPVVVTGIDFIRRKETDRIAAIVAELQRCGIEAHEDADGFTVVPGEAHGAEVETYEDHRMAMSMALLGLRVPGIRITNPSCVAKTFPDYFDVLESLRRNEGRSR